MIGLFLASAWWFGWLTGSSILQVAAWLSETLDLRVVLAVGSIPSLLLVWRWGTHISRLPKLRVTLRAPRFRPLRPVLLPVPMWWPPMILVADEVGSLWHLPPSYLDTLIRWLPCRVLYAPPQVFIPDGNTERIVFGYGYRTDGSLSPVGVILRALRQVFHLTAGMGAGKSRLLANVCQQVIQMGQGFILIDGKGDDAGNLTNTVRHLIPQEAEERLVIIDLLDTAWPTGMNPLAGVDMTTPGAKDMVLGAVMAVFARLDPETWSNAPGMQQYLQMSTLLVLEGERYPTLAHVAQALLSDDYRTKLLPGCQNTEVKQFWEVTFPQTGEQQKSSRDALMRRFGMLLVPEITRAMVTQTKPFSLLDAMENGKIVLVPLPHIKLGGLASAIGMLLFQSVVRAAFERPGNDQTRKDYPLVIDEFQVLVENGSERDVEIALSQLRAQGIPAIYAHQVLMQIGDLKDLMLGNALNRAILRAQEPDASVYARQYAASGLAPADISGQEPMEHQYMVLNVGGSACGPFSVRPLMWPQPVTIELAPEPALQPWQTVLPNPPGPLDHLIVKLVYAPILDRAALVKEMVAHLDDAGWNELEARWDAIRTAQRAYILAHPAGIPDRMERQTWLSRLLIRRPLVLVEIEYARIRRAIDPEGKALPAGGGGKRTREGKQATKAAAKEKTVRNRRSWWLRCYSN